MVKESQYEHYNAGLHDFLGTVIQECDEETLALYRSMKTDQLFVSGHLESFVGKDIVAHGLDVKEVRRFQEDALHREPDREQLIDMIQELVQQSCGNDSAAITGYANAMRLLAAEGRCRIVSEGGRRVIVEWLPQSI